MLAATALAGLVLIAAGIAVAVVVGFPAGGSVSAAAVVGVVAVGGDTRPCCAGVVLFWRATLNQAGILALFPGWSFAKSISLIVPCCVKG